MTFRQENRAGNMILEERDLYELYTVPASPGHHVNPLGS